MVTAIIAAAGKGRRFGAPENKVFASLAGEPVFLRTLRTLSNSPVITNLVLVTGADDLPRMRELTAGIQKLHTLCEGGAERYDSVWNALQHVPEGTQYVAVHDAARPLVSADLIARVVGAAQESGAAVPATPLSDTIKQSDDGQSTRQTIDRSTLYSVQTPQVFRHDLLTEAYRHARETGFTGTDDASYVEHLGHAVTLVPGELHNLKITVEADLQQAEALLRMQHPVPGIIRTGIGYDVHQLVPGRPLILGGVELQHPDGLGLDGHSDADVLLHAISDALLGAAALGDIGEHFPNTDPRYLGASSLVLLQEVGGILRAAGWEPVNVDAMLLAERPKIRPHVEEMRRRIAEALSITVGQVSIKATTNETLGFVGAEKGLCAHAVATIFQSASGPRP